MKSSISHILSFIIMILLIVISTFISIKLSFGEKRVIKILENTEYYEKSYSNIYKEIDNYVINDEVNASYKKYITKDLVTKDINNIIRNFYLKKESKINRYDDFYKIISEYTKDNEIANIYSKDINEIYVKNLFPVDEFNLLNKVYFGSLDLLFGLIVSILILLALSVILLFINKNFVYHRYALSGYSIFIILINILIKILFKDFLYTNEYFTSFLVTLVSHIFSYQLVISIILIIILFLTKNKIKNI